MTASSKSKPGDLDLVLEALRRLGLPYRSAEDDVRVWESVCPACRVPAWTLQLREPYRGASASLTCTTGCPDDVIRWALSADPADWRVANALDLAEEAREIAAGALELVKALELARAA